MRAGDDHYKAREQLFPGVTAFQLKTVCQPPVVEILDYQIQRRLRTGHGKPGKSWNLRISFSGPGKSWNFMVGHGKSWNFVIINGK